MKTRIIKIGNSRGIRIPKAFLDQADLEDAVDISIENDSLIIRRSTPARSGWDRAFSEMAVNKEDVLLDADEFADHSFDEMEWEW